MRDRAEVAFSKKKNNKKIILDIDSNDLEGYCFGWRLTMREIKLFLDTEFTDFKNPRLISFGLTSEEGNSFYAERLEGWTLDDCSAFVIQEVLPLLGPKMNRVNDARIRWCLREYARSLGGQATIYTDSLWHDEPVFKSIFIDRMNEWPPEFNLQFLEFDSPASELFYDSHGLRRHHALDDAIALKKAYVATRRP